MEIDAKEVQHQLVAKGFDAWIEQTGGNCYTMCVRRSPLGDGVDVEVGPVFVEDYDIIHFDTAELSMAFDHDGGGLDGGFEQPLDIKSTEELVGTVAELLR